MSCFLVSTESSMQSFSGTPNSSSRAVFLASREAFFLKLKHICSRRGIRWEGVLGSSGGSESLRGLRLGRGGFTIYPLL